MSGMRANTHGFQQAIGRGADLAHGAVEGLLIGFRGLAESADLAHKLQSGGGQLFSGCGLAGSAQNLDASAHNPYRFAHRSPCGTEAFSAEGAGGSHLAENLRDHLLQVHHSVGNARARNRSRHAPDNGGGFVLGDHVCPVFLQRLRAA